MDKNVYEFMFSMVGFKDELWLRKFPEPALILRNINIIRHQKGTVAGQSGQNQENWFCHR